MRCVLLAVSFVVALAVPGFASPSAALPYDLTLSKSLTTTSSTSHVLTGSTFGGVPVTGTVAGTTTAGTLNLVTDGKVFATGTYSCGSGCTFTGTIAGKPVGGMTLSTSSSFTGKSGTTAAGKATSSTFSNHGAWVSSVANWADTNLPAVQRGQIVSSAAKIEGHLASGKNDPGRASSQGAAKDMNGDKDKGKGNDGQGGGGKGKP
jgi:hypothetical protein